MARLRFHQVAAALVAASILAAASASAGAGRIEINQAVVEAAGGFPYIIDAPGSYVLTSSLEVPPDTQAILIQTNDVVLDLQGFQIRGPHSCNSAGCTTGFVAGVAPDGGRGRRVTVRGGSIQGFSGTCLVLLGGSYVTDMEVSACGNLGIQLSAGSLLRANRVSDTGRQGVVLIDHQIAFSDNVVRRNGLALATPAISGGSATGGNFCEDGSCFRVPMRRFYLTSSEFNGASADDPDNCADGFHFASLMEIADMSALRYDGERGQTASNGAQGPPFSAGGWAQTGSNSSSTTAGFGSCLSWGSGSSNVRGSVAAINGAWTRAAEASGLWNTFTEPCNTQKPIWCVEN